MRACFVAHGAAWSGSTRAFADAASLLGARGYETCLVAPAGSEAERCLGAAGHDVIGVASSGGWMRAGWRLRRVISARLSEVLFVHDDGEHLAAGAAVRLAGRGAVVRRTAAGERLSLGREGRFAMRLAATGFVFAHADDMRGMEPPRGALAAVVAPPGVADATPRPSAAVGAIQPDGQRLVVFAGADRRREMLVALRALALLAPRLPALRATVYSPAADADAVRIEAAALGVADRLDWRAAGARRDDVLAGAALAWVIASADDAVFATLDALRHGVPVLGERTPLSARYVEDGVTGILRHRSDEAQWASGIAAALAHPERADAMRVAARQSAVRWPFDAGADGWLHAADAARERTRWTV
ncbi:MAG: glycosyltransferase family protein [Gemmatimonadaceae bacterium]